MIRYSFLIAFILFERPIVFSANKVNSGCEFIKYVTYCEISNSKKIRVDTFVLQINDRNGENYTDISIPFSNNERISNIEGWIEDASGKRVRTLKNSDITQRSAISDGSLYEDDFIKTFQLKFNSYPYKIYYTYKQVVNQFITGVDWTPVLYSKVSTNEARLNVSVPLDCQIKKFVRNVKCLCVDTIGKFIHYEFLSEYKAVYSDELYPEPYENTESRVIFVPEHFNYGIEGSIDNWMTYGSWVYNLNKGLNDLPENEKTEVSKLLMGISDKREIVRTLYHYLQDHTRYVNVSIGIGGFKSFPASYVSQNKYGDCKALSNYMKALLEYAGIKSYFTLINASLQPENLVEEVPSDQFNHMILAVPLENDTIWLDNTSNTEPFAFVSSFIQNRKALLIDEKNSRLIDMPVFEKRDVTTLRKFLITINDFGNAESRNNFSFKGYLFEVFNELKTKYNQDDQDRIVREYLPFTNFDVLSWDLQKFDRDSAKIELITKISIYKLLKSLGTDYYFNVFPIGGITCNMPSERNLALQLPFPINNIDTLIYSIPDGFTVKSLPVPRRQDSQYGKYECEAKLEGNKVKVSKKIELKAGIYSVEEYKDFYKFISRVKEADKISVVLTKVP